MISSGSPFKNPVYRRLFAAQVTALTGSGLATIALALLAYDLAGDDAGVVLGVALALKMVAYVFVAPLVGGVAHLLPRKGVMISMDVVRAALLLLLPLVDAVWQVYLLIFLINGCSAVFKPLYQAIIPDILADETQYAKALSMFRIAYDMENVLSPSLAALLLTIWTFDGLFMVNGLAFIGSALLILVTKVPKAAVSDRPDRIITNLFFGIRSYLATPRMRGLLALYVAVAAASSMVIVNTVVYVRAYLGGSEVETAQAMLAVGGGSVCAALLIPHVLGRVADRTMMIAASWLLAVVLLLGITTPGFVGLLWLWFVLGFALSLVQTPSGRLVTASCQPSDRTALFAANFSLSHGCWFFGYLLAGYLSVYAGLTVTFVVMALLVVSATITAQWIWPKGDETVLEHWHEVLDHHHAHIHDEHHQHQHMPGEEPVAADIPHLHHHHHQQLHHRHPFFINLHHRNWPN